MKQRLLLALLMLFNIGWFFEGEHCLPGSKEYGNSNNYF